MVLFKAVNCSQPPTRRPSTPISSSDMPPRRDNLSIAIGDTTVRCRPGVIEVQNRSVFGRRGDRWKQFVACVGALPEVQTLEIHRDQGMAAIRFSAKRATLSEVLEKMASILAALHTSPQRRPIPRLLQAVSARSSIRLHHRGTRLSVWTILEDAPGKLSVRDEELCKNAIVVERLRTELRAIRGIRGVSRKFWSDAVSIQYDPSLLNREEILLALDTFVESGGLITGEAAPSSRKWALATTTLGLATAGTLFFPALLPVSAALLVATNLSTFRDAWRDLCQKKIGLPGLHTVIVAATLANGGYLAANLMNWLLVYWRDRRSRLTVAGQQMLVDSVRYVPDRAWVVHPGAELETPLSRLETGAVIALRPGEEIPVDGRIVSGMGLVQESFSGGSSTIVVKRTGDAVFQGALLVGGEIQVRVGRIGEAAMASSISRLFEPLPAEHRPEADTTLADKAIPPTLMTAGLGLMVGDANVAGAILRPDYATGPALGDSLAVIEGIGACLDQGIVIRRLDVFTRMADVDVVVFDHDDYLESRQLTVREIQVAAGLQGEEILNWAACGLRMLSDRRARAILAAQETTGRSLLERPLQFESGAVRFDSLDHEIAIIGLDRDCQSGRLAPLSILYDGRLAGNILFQEGTELEARDALFDLRVKSGLQVEVVSAREASLAEQTAEALGADGFHICQNDLERQRFFEQLAAEGHRVAFVGNCTRFPLAAAAAHVAVSTHPAAEEHEPDVALAWLMSAQVRQFGILRDTAVQLRRQLRSHANSILVPNMLCVAGALLFGFSSLAVVLLSNLGTLSVYSRGRASLQRVAHRFQGRRRRPSNTALRIETRALQVTEGTERK
jgi:cation transport ATPase